MKIRRNSAVILFFCSILTVMSYKLWDIPLAYYCRDLSLSTLGIAQMVTTTGDSKWYFFSLIPAYVVLRFFLKSKLWSGRVLFLLVSISASGLINTLVKWIAGRNRPVNLFINNQFGFDYFKMIHESTSFPSGHTVTAFTLATAISILFPRLSIPVFAAAVAIGSSRIMITAHYLSDVLTGAGIGILCTLAVKHFFDRFNLGLVCRQQA
jgi:membrane-associated phospholipid phosphatase